MDNRKFLMEVAGRGERSGHFRFWVEIDALTREDAERRVHDLLNRTEPYAVSSEQTTPIDPGSAHYVVIASQEVSAEDAEALKAAFHNVSENPNSPFYALPYPEDEPR